MPNRILEVAIVRIMWLCCSAMIATRPDLAFTALFILLAMSHTYVFTYLSIYLFLPPALNPKSYGRARVLEAPSRPMLVIGHSFYEEMLIGRNKDRRRCANKTS